MSDHRIKAIEKALLALGWPAGGFVVSEDGPRLGDWHTFMAFTTNPSGTLVDIWAGPDAGRDPSHIIIAGQPLQRTQLRALVGSAGVKRAVMQVVVRTAGHGQDIGDVASGELKGLPGYLESVMHPPRIEDTPAGRELVCFARTHAGAYVRLHAPLDGPGPVELTIEPPGPKSGQPEPTSASAPNETPEPRPPLTPPVKPPDS